MDEEEGGFEEELTTAEDTTEDEEITDATATDYTDTEDERAEPVPTEMAEYIEDDINVTDSQVMIQLKEAENEAEFLRREIAEIRAVVEDFKNREELGDKEAIILGEKQTALMEKVAALDEVTKRIEKLLRLTPKAKPSEEATVLSEDEEEEEEEAFPDDLLPRVVICSSWDDMMPKVVVCMDMKKPGAAKKLEGERDENGLTPEQREALDLERRCMAEERSKLQCQLAMMEEEMRTIMRENDILSRKMAHIKAESENQPPFEFEMSVSAANPPKPGEMDHGGHHPMGRAVGPGTGMGLPPSTPVSRGDQRNCPCSSRGIKLPCGGPTEIPGRSIPCPSMLQNLPAVPSGPPPSAGKRCRKEFNECPCSGGMATEMLPFPMNPQPVDLSIKPYVQPQSQQGGERAANYPNEDKKFNIAQQLQEIEMEVRRMQREINRATKDKETLKAQQATLNCAKSLLM